MSIPATVTAKAQSAVPLELQIRGAHLYDKTRRWVTGANGKKIFTETPYSPRSRTSISPTSISATRSSTAKAAGSPTSNACATRRRCITRPRVRSARSGR